MKFSLYSVIAIEMLLLLFCIYSCKKSGSHNVDFDMISVHKSIALSKDKKFSPKCEVDINIHYVRQNTFCDSLSEKINNTIISRFFGTEGTSFTDAVDSFAKLYIENYIDRLSPLYEKDKDNIDRYRWYEYKYIMNTDIHLGSNGDILVYIVNLRSVEGGEHSINKKYCINFNVNTGGVIALADVFVPGYEKQLNDILLGALMDKIGKRNIQELYSAGYLYSMDMFVPENFIISDSSITFIYNTYEIAPYSKGIIELTIDKSDINKLFKK